MRPCNLCSAVEDLTVRTCSLFQKVPSDWSCIFFQEPLDELWSCQPLTGAAPPYSEEDALFSLFLERSDRWLDRIYSANAARYPETGFYSLCADVFTLLHAQLSVFREELRGDPAALARAASATLRTLMRRQTAARDGFLGDAAGCCAVAAEFLKMAEQAEDIARIGREGGGAEEALRTTGEEAARLFTADAVYAAQFVHLEVFRTIEGAIGKELFYEEWEARSRADGHRLIRILLRTLEDYLLDFELWLDYYLVEKVLEALLRATVIFYARGLLNKTAHRKIHKHLESFLDPQRALLILDDEIGLLKQFFADRLDQYPTLNHALAVKFSFLEQLAACLRAAAATDPLSSAEEPLRVLFARLQNDDLTRCVLYDLWHLIDPAREPLLDDTLASLGYAPREYPMLTIFRNTDDGENVLADMFCSTLDCISGIVVEEARPGSREEEARRLRLGLEEVLTELYFSQDRKAPRDGSYLRRVSNVAMSRIENKFLIL